MFNSTTSNFTVSKRVSDLSVVARGNSVGGNATIEVSVQSNATGYVTVNVNGTNYTINLTGGAGSVQIKGLGNGTYYVHATYLGDSQYLTDTNNDKTFEMTKVNTTMVISVDSIDYAQNANITVTVRPDATGFITIRINETRNITLPVVKGKVNWIVDGLAADNYTVYANYSGDGRYNVNNTNKVNRSFEVRQVTPVITIETVEVSSARNATVVVHITPGTTGNINITVNGENYSSPIENGVAKIVIKQLNVGNYTVIANYSGDRNFTNASTTQINKVNVHKFACYDMNVTAPDTKVGVNTTIVVNVPEDVTGNVSIYVNGSFAGNATINHGVATLSLNKIIAGKYVVNATFGDAKYANKTVTTNFHVIKWDTPMNITVADAKVGDTVKVIVSVPKEIAGGTATIEINGKKYTNVTDNKGNATFYVADLTYGNKTVVAIYEGNNKYVFNSTTQNFTVTKRSSQVNVTASATVVGMDAIVNVTIPANATGYVIVNVNGTNYTVNTTNGNGSIVIKNLENGKYIVNVTYIGDDQYLSSTNGTDFTILRIQPTFSVNGTDITYGAKELIKFESVESITAPIKVEINGRNYTAFIIEGKGNLTVENLAAGNYNVTIYFAGNDKYMNATANNTFTVEKGVMPIYVIAQNITYSEESLFTIYVNATGKVDIFIFNATDGDMVTAFGNIDIVNYEYVLPVFLDAGNYTVRVDYKGNANYTDSSAKANFTVFKKDPTITIEVQNITYGGVEHIIVRVNAEGNVTIKVNGTEETIVLREDDNAIVVLRAAHNPLPTYNEKAHEYLYNLNVGEYPVEVTFNGNENYNKATATALFFVNADNTTVNVDVDDIATGGKETINVTLSNKNATGNVTINVDGVNYTRPITNGTANLTLTNLPAGNHSVVVIYEGDNNFRGNWTSAIFNVTKVKPTLTIDVNDTSAGKVAKIIINLPDNATGFVVIDVDGTKYHADIVPGQEIALEVDNLLNKTYHVTAEYSGDEYWDTADNSSSFNVNITKADISVKVENITVGDMAIINITAPKELNGNVTVNVDGKNYTVYVAGGNGILVVPGLDVGNYTVNVTFAGTDRFGPSNTTAKLEVSKVNVTSEDIKVIDQGNGTVVVVVGGNATGNVTVYVDGKNFTGEIVNGTAVITLENVTPGVNDIEVVYSGDDKHSNSTVNGTVTIPRLDTEFAVTVDEGKEGENTTITVKVPKDTTGNVTVTIDGQKYTAEIDNGTAVITVENLTAGNKTAIIEYAGDANYTSNYTTVNFTVGNAKAVPELVVVDHGNGTVVVVVGDNATGNVTIKVGDNVFNATVVNGTAVVQVGNLTPGVNDVEVIYSGDDTHTNSTVNTTIIGPKYDTPFVVNVTEVTEGETATITVKVPENATGNVTVTFDGQKYSAEIVNGTATIPISNLTAGDKSLIVEYAGDDNYASNYTIGNFTVDEAKVVPDMKVIDQGNGTVVVVVGDNASGNVTIKVGDKEYNSTVVNGTAVVQLDGNVTPGTHEVDVIYSGDDTHEATNATVEITAPKYSTEVKVDASEVTEGEPLVVTVEVPDGATGNVTVYIDGKEYPCEIKDGVAVVTIDDLTAGNKTYVVEYSGDGNFSANYTIGNVTVKEAKSTPDMKVIDQGNGTVVVVIGDDATGNVTVKVGDKEFNATVVNGTAVVQLDGNVTPGTHEVEIIYSGDATHEAANSTANITAPKYDSSIDVVIGEAKEGEQFNVTVKVPDGATGDVIVNVGGKNYTGTVKDGEVIVTVDNLTAGDHTIAVVYTGDDNFTGTYSIGNLTVEKAKEVPDMKVIDQGNGTVVVVVGDNATGNVTVKVDGKEYNATVVNGTAVVTLDGNVTPGTHEIEVIYSGDDTHNATSTDANITAPKYDTPIDLEIGEAKEGENTTITVKVPEGTTGDVVVSVGGKNYTAPIENGKAVVTVDDLTPGNHTIAVEYFGDDNYVANYTIGNLTVVKAKETPDMKVIDQGNGTVVVVVGDNATGNVTVKVGDKEYNATVVNGTAVVQLDGNVTPGTHEVEVIYSGDDTHDAANATSEITAPKYDAPIEVEIGDAKEGEPTVITVTVPDDATGNVTVSVGGKDYTVPVENGKAVVTVDNLTDGDHTIAVKYSGDDNYAGNSSVGNLTVEKALVNPDVKVIDQGNGTVVVVVGDNATGNVTIKVGDKEYNATVVNGTAIVELDGNVTPGTHEVEVIYSGDDTHEAANATSEITAPKYDAPIEVEIGDAKEGEPTVITVKVPENATGNVTVSVGGKDYTVPVEDGKAVVTVDNLTDGDHTIAVVYSGDDNYVGNSSVGNLTVEKALVNPDVKVIDQGNGTVVVVVGDNATGNVTIKVGDKEYNATVVNGTAVVQLDGNVTPGTHEIEVIYSGDDTHNATSTDANITAPKYDTPIDLEIGEAKEGENTTITVKVPEGTTGDVVVSVGGKNYTAPIENGKAVVTVDDLSPGNHTIAIEYFGDDNYIANYTVGNLTVDKAKVVPDMKIIDQGNGTVVVVVGDNATGNVTIKVGDKEYNATVVNGTAVVQLDGNVTPGTHEVEIIYSGDDTHDAANATSEITAPKYDAPIEVEIGDAKEGESVTVTVTVPDDATGNVTVSVGGKDYTVPVENGKAVVTVDNLTDGDHTIAVKYSGDDNYAGNSSVGNLTVEKAKETPDMKVIDQGNGTVVVVVGDNATGNVTIKVGDKEYNATVVNGTAVVQLDGNVTPGDHEVEIIYSGDDTHEAANTTSVIKGAKLDTPLDITVENIKVGDKETIVVNVPEGVTGSITIEIDGETYTAPIEDGKATFSVENLDQGKKSVFVKYDGDENYNANTTTAQFEVDKRPTEVTATVEDIYVGETLKVTVKLPENATGQVLIDIDGVGYYVNITNGTGVAEIPHLTNGVYDVNVTYTGDDQYMPSHTSATFKVEKIESFVIPMATNIMVGENENIKLLVPNDATGNVTVIIDGEEYNFNLDDGTLTTTEGAGKYTVAVSGGNGQLVISGLPKGEYYVSVRYNGDEKYLPATNTTLFTVSKIDTKIDEVDQGNGTLVIKLPEDATGNVTVKIGDETFTAKVENGTAVINLENATPGVHEAEIYYSGDNNYASKTDKITVEVPKYNAPIDAAANDINVGETVVIVVNVPQKATGTVTVEVDGKSYTGQIKDGKAEISIPDLTAGDKTAHIEYGGDDNYLENSTSVSFTVSKVKSTISASGKDITAGKDEVITVNVPKDAIGQVLVEINGVGYYGDIVNGVAKVIVPKLAAGKYTAKVTYGGDGKYLENSTTVKFTVEKAKSKISATGDEIMVGDDATVTIKLPTDATGIVTITIDGKTYTAQVFNGKAIVSIPGLAAGTYKATVVYSGDDKYGPTTTVTYVVVNDNNNGTNGNGSNEITLDVSEGGVSLSDYPTGNPLWILLLVLLTIGSNEIRRRFRK
ncbi:Ig-like domain-containing protein [Methanobrevibacter sp.]|uniref:Ig-like domain-containing protein n=1 Tax=Methanobrevibacter sp. TaxID=66852 RepID=UPI0025ECF688|nr:Ig-like domain-containing protein [Methanobrevibacter sp.]